MATKTKITPNPSADVSNENQLAEKLKTDLIVFDPVKAEALKLVESYKSLTIKHAFDKEGTAEVKAARLDLMRRRTAGDKIRKGLNESALNYQRGVNSYWNEIEAIITPEETRLKELETKFEKERERLEKEKFQARVVRLGAIGLIQMGNKFETRFGTEFLEYDISIEDVQNSEDSYFEQFIQEVEIIFIKVENEKILLSAWDLAIAENNRLNAAELKRKEDEVNAKLAKLKALEDEQKPPAPPSPPKQAPSFPSGGYSSGASSRPNDMENPLGREDVKHSNIMFNTEKLMNTPPAEREYILRQSQPPLIGWKILSQDKATKANIIDVATITRVGADIVFKPNIDKFTLDELIKITGALHSYRNQIS